MGKGAGELERAASPERDGDDAGLKESTAATRQDIEMTRAEMSSTIDAIQDKLDPDVLSEQAKETAHDVTDYAISEAKTAAREMTDHALAQAKETVVDLTRQGKSALREATIGKVETMAHSAGETTAGWRQTAVETVKANPIPAALVGLGLGWMFLNRSSGSSGSSRQQNGGGYGQRAYGSTYRPGGYVPAMVGGTSYGGQAVGASAYNGGTARDMGQEAKQAVGRVAEGAQDTAGRVVEQVQGTAANAIEQVQEAGGTVLSGAQDQAFRAQTFLERQLDDKPLLVGAVAVAIGAVLAGAMPSTRREDEMLGDTRDQLMGTARQLTQETMDKVGRVVDEAQTAAKNEAEHQSLIPEGGSSMRS